MLFVRLCRLQVPRQWGESALKRGSCAPRCVGRCRARSPGRAPRCVRLDRAPRCRRLRGASTLAPAGRFLDVSGGVGVLSVDSGGLEPCRCSRPVRDAAPTIFCSDRLAADTGPGRRRSQLPQIRPDALEAPDFVGIGEKPARQDGQRGRRSGGAVSLGTLPAGTTEAQVDDMMMVLEVADEATPAPSPA